jgi:hypothetical protein
LNCRCTHAPNVIDSLSLTASSPTAARGLPIAALQARVNVMIDMIHEANGQAAPRRPEGSVRHRTQEKALRIVECRRRNASPTATASTAAIKHAIFQR